MRKLRLFAVSLLSVCMLLPVGTTAVWAAENAETVTEVAYNEYEAIFMGEEIAITASVTRGGETSDELIRYTDFDVREANVMFNSFHAEGYIDGWDGVIEQEILVIPRDIVYFINAGTNYTDQEYIAGTEGALGLELDPSGETGKKDPWFDAILRKVPQISNKLPSKQYFPEVQGDWGYTGNQQFATDKALEPRTIYESSMVPKRGTTFVEYTMPLAEGKYDVYIGTYSYWFTRAVTLSFNGEIVSDAFEIKPKKEVNCFKEIQPENGKIVVNLNGAQLYDEAMISFLVVVESGKTLPLELNVPTSPEIVPMTQTSVEVGNLTVGAKLQAYDYETGNLILETMVTDETMQVEFTIEQLQDCSRIAFAQSDGLASSEEAVTLRTDIVGFKAEYSELYTALPLKVNLQASAESGICAVEIRRNGEKVWYEELDTPVETLSYDYFAETNGEYEAVLTSGIGAYSYLTFTVTNVDDVEPTFSYSFGLENAQKSSAQSLNLSLDCSSVSTIVESGYYFGGEAFTLGSDREVNLSDGGFYRFYLVNEVGKRDLNGLYVNLLENEFKTFAVRRSTADYTNQGIEITLDSAEGYSFVKATVYFKDADGACERMIVNGNVFHAYENGEYFVLVENEKGINELAVITVSNITEGNPQMTPIIVTASVCGVVLIASVLAFVFVLKKNRKS